MMTSDNRITDIVLQLGELRQLLLVIDQSGKDISPILLQLAREKAEKIFDSVDQLGTPEFWATLNQQLLDDWKEEPKPAVEVEPQELPVKEEVQPAPAQPSRPVVEVVKKEIVAVNDTQEDVTLDEVLQRKQAKDLRKALSLNDRFRFCRELFENNNERMNETLALIDSMDSYETAEDYLFNTLGWDAENLEVVEFMTIVQKHFL